MKRWDSKRSSDVEDLKIDAFVNEVVDVCRKHRMAISHEDGHGAFIIESIEAGQLHWFRHAHKGSSLP